MTSITKQRDEQAIDEAVEESFPASDPPAQSSTPKGGLEGKKPKFSDDDDQPKPLSRTEEGKQGKP